MIKDLKAKALQVKQGYFCERDIVEFRKAVNHKTILKLIDVIEKQEKALEFYEHLHPMEFEEGFCEAHHEPGMTKFERLGTKARQTLKECKEILGEKGIEI